jgi:hypothetical protein
MNPSGVGVGRIMLVMLTWVGVSGRALSSNLRNSEKKYNHAP